MLRCLVCFTLANIDPHMGWAEKSVSIILRKHTNISKENDQLIKSHPDSSQNALRNVPKVSRVE